MPKVQPTLKRAPSRPSDLTAARLKGPRSPATLQDQFVQAILDVSEKVLGEMFVLQVVLCLFVERKSHPVEGIFQDPDTHTLFLSICPMIPAQPLIVRLDSFDGNDVESPGAPLWASRILVTKDTDIPLQLLCSGDWLRHLAWRWSYHSSTRRDVLALLRLAIVKYLDSFLKIHRKAMQGLKLTSRRPQPRPTLRNVELVAERVGGMWVNLDALREAEDLYHRLLCVEQTVGRVKLL